MDSVYLRVNETYDDFFNRCNNITYFDCTEEEMLWWMMGSRRLPLKEIVPLSVVLIVIFLTGVMGNISVCVLIVRHPGLHTATNYYLFSLAISDLLLLLFGLPNDLSVYWHQYPYSLGIVFCKLRALISEAATYVSVLTISAFSLERYLAICHPLHLYAMAGLTRASRIILVLWIISIMCASPFALYTDISYRDYPPNSGNISSESAFCALLAPSPLLELSSIFFFFVPAVLILCLYVRMGLHIRSTKITEKTKLGLLNGHIHGETRQAKSRKAIIRMLDQFYEAVMWMEMAKKNEAREYLSTHLSDTTNQSIPKMEIETRTFMESTSTNSNVNKPEMILVPMGNIRNVPIERAAKRISKRSLSLDSTHELLKKLPRMVKIAESANNVSNHSSNSIGIHEDYSNQELRTQGIILNKSAEAYNTEKLVSPESNTNNTTPALQTSTSFRNQAYQLSKLIHDKRISVVSDDYLFQDRGKREIITDRSTLANGNDQITCPQRSTQNTESAMQTLINLKNRCSQLSVRTHANQPLTANKNYVRQEPRGQEKLDRRPTEVNHGTYSQDVTNNKLSILANRASEHPAETQYPQAYNIIVQKDSLTNKIIIEPSTEMECIDQRAPSQSVTNTAAAAQNSLPLANQPSHLSVKSHEPQKLPDFGGYLEDPRTPTVIIRTTTGGNAMDLRDNKEGCHLRNYRHMTDKAKNTQSAVQEFSNIKNHLIQSEPLHEKHNISTASKNYLKEDPHAKTIFNGCPTKINGIDKKAFPQSITKNTPFATSNCQNSANSFSCSCKNSQRQRFAPITRDYFNQYPRMQSTLSGRPTEGNCSRQNVNTQSNTDNKSFANRYSPITANESQSSRDSTEEPQLYIDTSDHQSQECTQEIPVKRFINQDRNGQSVYTESNTNNTTNRASIIQNTANPSFEESSSSSSSTDQERYAQEIPVKSVNNTNHTGKSTDHEQYAQEIPVKSVNNTNHTGKSTIPETNTENRSTIIRNSPVEINKLANDRAITEQMLTNDFNILFRKMESTLSDTYAMLNHVCDSLIEYGESFQIILKRANDYCNSRINESTGS